MSETAFLAKAAGKKSFLEDPASFFALSEEATLLQSDWTKFDQQRAKGTKRTKGGTPKVTTKKTKGTGKKKTGKTKTPKVKAPKAKTKRARKHTKKSLLEDPTSFLTLSAEFDQLKREAGL